MTKLKLIVTFVFILTGLILPKDTNMGKKKKDFPVLKGPYLGQKPPGTIPKIFAPGIISTEKDEINGSGDLYISFQEEKGSWTEPINMGKPINSNKLEFCPMISPDGKYLFFSSRRRGNEDIYWVDAKVIENLKPQEIK